MTQYPPNLIFDDYKRPPYHVGNSIKLLIEDFETDIATVAKMMGVSEWELSKIINREVPIGVDMALRLATVFGMDAQHFLNMQRISDDAVRKRKLEWRMKSWNAKGFSSLVPSNASL